MDLRREIREDIWKIADRKKIDPVNFYKEVLMEVVRKGKVFNMKWVISICKRLEIGYEEIIAYIYDTIAICDMISISKEVNSLYNKKIQPILDEFNGRE